MKNSMQHDFDPTKPLKASIWIALPLVLAAALVFFFVKDVFFARDLACSGVFSIALSAVYVVVEKRIFGAAQAAESEKDAEEAGRLMVIQSMIASVVKLFALGIGLALMVVLFKLHPVPVVIGVSINYFALIVAHALFRSKASASNSNSQQDKES